MVVRDALSLLSLLLLLWLGCTSLYPYTPVPEAERGRYRAYSRIMTAGQMRTYLTLPTASERAAYARQIGASQALDSLSEADRAAVLQGYPFAGMSKAALLLLWGEPYWRQGPPQDERWYYYGDYFSLAEVGSGTTADTVMEVSLENGYLKWWEERVPSDENGSIFHRHFFDTPAD